MDILPGGIGIPGAACRFAARGLLFREPWSAQS